MNDKNCEFLKPLVLNFADNSGYISFLPMITDQSQLTNPPSPNAPGLAFDAVNSNEEFIYHYLYHPDYGWSTDTIKGLAPVAGRGLSRNFTELS